MKLSMTSTDVARVRILRGVWIGLDDLNVWHSFDSLPRKRRRTYFLRKQRFHCSLCDFPSSICDQSSTNVAAINGFIEETRAKYLRKNAEYRKVGFEVNDKEVVPMVDPPHLLKGIRNNLLTKDLKFVQDDISKVAKWDHIVQFCKMDQVSRPSLVSKVNGSTCSSW